MAMALNNDQNTLILFHYDQFRMNMCKVQCEYQIVEELASAFGVGKNYVQDLWKGFFESGTLDRQSRIGRSSVEKEERMDLIV